MSRLFAERPPAAAIIGCLGFLLIGWSSLLVPSLIRSIEHDFGQTDAGVGLFYFLNAGAYVTGSLGGGVVTERIGRRRVLALAVLLAAIGLGGIATVASWPLFLLAAIPLGLGSGAIDGGGNALILDMFASARGRALNLLHLFFSLGALGSPFVVGRLVESGVPWQAVVVTFTKRRVSEHRVPPAVPRSTIVMSRVASLGPWASKWSCVVRLN